MIVCAFYGIITESWRYSTSSLYTLPHSSPLCGQHETCTQSPTPIVQPCGCRLLHHQGPDEFFLRILEILEFFCATQNFRDLWGVRLPPNSHKKWLKIVLGSSESRMNSPGPKHQHLQCLAHRRTQVDDECQFPGNWIIYKLTISKYLKYMLDDHQNMHIIWNYITINPFREKMGRNIIWNHGLHVGVR